MPLWLRRCRRRCRHRRRRRRRCCCCCFLLLLPLLLLPLGTGEEEECVPEDVETPTTPKLNVKEHCCCAVLAPPLLLLLSAAAAAAGLAAAAAAAKEAADGERMTGGQCAHCGVSVTLEERCQVTSDCGAHSVWLCFQCAASEYEKAVVRTFPHEEAQAEIASFRLVFEVDQDFVT